VKNVKRPEQHEKFNLVYGCQWASKWEHTQYSGETVVGGSDVPMSFFLYTSQGYVPAIKLQYATRKELYRTP